MVIKLSEASIDDAAKRMRGFLSDNFRVANERIVERLVSLGESKAYALNNAAQRSSIDPSAVSSAILESRTKGYIILHGKSAVYDEFGTGEEGLSDPHPMKGNFGLNPYNSGPIVSKNIDPITNRHYWYYNGKRTEGIPAGKQMYNTAKYIREIKDQIIKKELNGSIKRINK